VDVELPDSESCADNQTQVHFETFVEQVSENICGKNEHKLVGKEFRTIWNLIERVGYD